MGEIIVEDPLLKFFHNLLESEEEKRILSMIFKDCSEEEILEALINYKPNVEPNA